jgi:two-component system, OmpR family, response regulator
VRRLLIVDDDLAVRQIATLSLARLGGFEVFDAPSGASAVALAAAYDPALILLDVMMPVLDGPATLARLNADARTASIPVAFLTAKVQEREVKRLLALGAVAVIGKPFDPVELVARVTQLLQR